MENEQQEQVNGEPGIKMTICLLCKEHNLTDQVTFNKCKRCDEIYCLHFASTVDPAYCTYCLNDIQVTEEVITKTETHYNEQTDKIYERKRRAKRISMGGMHWLFQARKISMLTDTELEVAIEYHRDILNNMLYEREERRVQHFARNRGKALPVRFSGNSVTESSTETIVTKQTKVKNATKADPAAQLAEALKILMGSGMSAEDIAKMAVKK